jgi:hypothetical protein
MMDMGTVGMDTDMTTTEAVDIMKEDKRCCLQGRGVVSNAIFNRYYSMKRYIRTVCVLGLAFITIIGAGLFSTASAEGYYGGHRDNHHRYRRVYAECADRYRVESHRFQRCMDYHLQNHHRW